MARPADAVGSDIHEIHKIVSTRSCSLFSVVSLSCPNKCLQAHGRNDGRRQEKA